MSFSKAVSFEFPPPGYWTGYYAQYFASHSWLEATANSFIIAFGSMVFTLIAALPAAFGFRALSLPRQERPEPVDDAAADRPAVVSALGYYSFLSPMRLVGTHAGMIIAHSVLSIPVAFLVIAAALKGFDRNLERAAMSAGRWPAAHLSLGDVAGAAARDPGRRPVRVPALVQRGGGGDLHCRPRRVDPAQEDVRIDPPRIRSRDRRGIEPASPARCCSACSSRCSFAKETPKVRKCSLILSSNPLGRHRRSHGPRGSRTIRRRVARRHRIHRRDLPGEPEIPDVLNHVCYPSLTDLPEAPDCRGVSASAKPLLPEQVRLAVKRGARAAVIYDAGFAELGEDGARQQAEIAGLCREAGMPVCGPNCMGILNPTARVTTYKQTLMDTNGLAGQCGLHLAERIGRHRHPVGPAPLRHQPVGLGGQRGRHQDGRLYRVSDRRPRDQGDRDLHRDRARARALRCCP
jgi:hypothetical protein